MDDSEEEFAESEVGHEEMPSPRVVFQEPVAQRIGAVRAAFRMLDTVDLNVEFSRRVNGIKTVPSFLAGSFRNALRVALEEAAVGNRSKI